MKPLAVFDRNTRKRLCFLRNAFGIKYTKKKNELWSAQFSLPSGDEKEQYLEIANLVEIWDTDAASNDKYVGLFRILPSQRSKSSTTDITTYTLEHVVGLLIDDILHGWNEVGGNGVYTKDLIGYILARQTVKQWVLGSCDYSYQFLHGWQDENLLNALFSITGPFIDTDYRWEYETKNYPWTLSLRRAPATPAVDVRYRKNINGMTRTVDTANLVTRLYSYGYGENDNRLTLKTVNNNLEYIQSANAAKYGVIKHVWVAEEFTDAKALLDASKAMLKVLEEPSVAYDFDISFVEKISEVEPGDMVRVVTDEFDENLRVIEVTKDDVSGAPKSGKVTIASKVDDLAQETADLANRQRISATYSQGAESIFADSLYDNADAANPAELTFMVPQNAVHVNNIDVSISLEAFRAYSKAASAGGGTTKSSEASGGQTRTTSSGGASTRTSSSGGGENKTSSSGGGSTKATESSGGSTPTTSSGGGRSSSTTPSLNYNPLVSTTESGGSVNSKRTGGIDYYETIWSLSDYQYYRLKVSTGDTWEIVKSPLEFTSNKVASDTHTHAVPNISAHTHEYRSLLPNHTHGVDIPAHTHSVSIPAHTHSVEIDDHKHTIDIPNHTHTVDVTNHTHQLTIPDHTHNITYGIYKGGTASNMTVYIDDRLIGTYGRTVDGLNLIDFMQKNANGDVLRGKHTLKVVPNALTRVECAVQIRLFTNARGSGQH